MMLPEVSVFTVVFPDPEILWLDVTLLFSTLLIYTLPLVNAVVVLVVAVEDPTTFLLS
jgi:hypothetical protein